MSEELRIFRAGPRDFDLAQQALVEVHARTADPAAVAAFLADEHCYLILATQGDLLVGSLNGYRLRPPNRPEPQFFLSELDVRLAHRGRGIGRQLTQAFVDLARREKAFEVWVLTNRSNLPATARTSLAASMCPTAMTCSCKLIFDHSRLLPRATGQRAKHAARVLQ